LWIGHATGTAGSAASDRHRSDLVAVDRFGAVRRLVAPVVALAGNAGDSNSCWSAMTIAITWTCRRCEGCRTTRGNVVPIGNGARLGKPNVVELDWWQTHEIETWR